MLTSSQSVTDVKDSSARETALISELIKRPDYEVVQNTSLYPESSEKLNALKVDDDGITTM